MFDLMKRYDEGVRHFVYRGHVKAVAEMNMRIAGQYGLDKSICELCGYLHDISAVVTAEHPLLLHQRISKMIAEQEFSITDEQILSAIECNTTLKMNPFAYDMALLIADKPAWDQES